MKTRKTATANKTSYPQLIVYRNEPCRCGCQGQDPWHQRYYKRVVTLVSETEGYCRLPMSSCPVRVTREVLAYSEKLGRNIYGAWEVDRDSIEYKS